MVIIIANLFKIIKIFHLIPNLLNKAYPNNLINYKIIILLFNNNYQKVENIKAHKLKCLALHKMNQENSNKICFKITVKIQIN